MLHELLCGDQPPFLSHKQLQHLKLPVAQSDTSAAAFQFKRGAVQRDITCSKDGRLIPAASARQGPDPGGKFPVVKGLGQIVIRSAVQPGHPVLHLAFCGQKKHGCGDILGPQGRQSLDTVQLGHHDVQNDAVIVFRKPVVQSILPVVDRIHGVMLPFEQGLQYHGHFRLVVRN